MLNMSLLGLIIHMVRMGKGTMETLAFPFKTINLLFPSLKNFNYGDEKVSSTLIRSCIKEGEMEQLSPLLGRFYTYKWQGYSW